MEDQLNEYKYDLMLLTQDLGKVVPSSELAKELLSKSKALEEKIEKLEKELQKLESTPKAEQGEFKRIVSADGEVKIWSSERKPQS